jgi:hypothetical protein
MSDVIPDYHVEIQRLRVQVASLKQNIERYKLEVMEMDSRRRKALENLEATGKALKETSRNIDQVLEAHGEPEEI